MARRVAWLALVAVVGMAACAESEAGARGLRGALYRAHSTAQMIEASPAVKSPTCADRKRVRAELSG
jgi:hypothetical protein